MNMRTQAATIRMTGAIEKSTQVMQSMSKLVKLPELQKTMTEMSKEMMKMGIIDELMDDAMESLDPEDMEEEVDAQVLLFITTHILQLLNYRLKKSFTRSQRVNSVLFLALEHPCRLPKSHSPQRPSLMMRMTCSRD